MVSHSNLGLLLPIFCLLELDAFLLFWFYYELPNVLFFRKLASGDSLATSYFGLSKLLLLLSILFTNLFTVKGKASVKHTCLS